MKKLIFGAALVAAIFALLIGCAAPGQKTTGAITVSVVNGIMRSFMPGHPIVPASYDLTVTGGPTAVSPRNITGTTTILGLLPGSYHAALVAQNAEPYAIGSGSADVVVVVGPAVDCPITVLETAGTGGIALSASWPSGSVVSPTIASTKSYNNGADESITWTPGVGTPPLSASWADAALLNGWYVIGMRLFDMGVPVPVAGFVTLARVGYGQTTTGHVDLVPNVVTGGFHILITWSGFDSLTLGSSLVPEGDVYLFNDSTSTTTVVSGADVYVWYKNGVATGSTGTTFEFNRNDYAVGDHSRIDVIGFSTDGRRAGQLTWNVSRLDALVAQARDITLSMTPTTTGSGVTLVVTETDKVTMAGYISMADSVEGVLESGTVRMAAGSYYANIVKSGVTHWYSTTEPGTTDPAKATMIVLPIPPTGVSQYVGSW